MNAKKLSPETLNPCRNTQNTNTLLNNLLYTSNNLNEKKTKNPENVGEYTTIKENLSLNQYFKNSRLIGSYKYKLEDIDKSKDFFVAYQKLDDTYCYQSYNTFEDFMEIQNKEITPELRRWNEIIVENRPVPEYYDLDAKPTDNNTDFFDYYKIVGEDKIIDEFIAFRNKFVEKYYIKYDIKSNFVISTSSNENKFSVHIVVRNGLFFQNAHQALKIFTNEFLKFLKQPINNTVITFDTQVYSKSRNMRLIGNTKLGKNNFLKKHHNSSSFDDKLFLFSHIQPEDTLFFIPKKIKTPPEKINNNNKIINVNKDLMELKNLLHIIDNKNTNNWLVTGQIISDITNNSDEGLEIFKKWSENDYDNYDEKHIEYTWNRYPIDNNTVDNLRFIACNDNPEQYYELYPQNIEVKNEYANIVFEEENIDKDIELAESIVNDFTHNNLAKIYALHSKGEIFFTTAYGWIIFNNETKIWNWDNDKTALIHPISSFFSNIMKKYCKLYFDKNSDMKMSKDEEKEFVNKIKMHQKIKTDVGNSGFTKGIIEQIQSLLTKDNKFVDNFDAKPNLMAFSDGKCIDLLNKGEVRDIVKEDYIITTTGYAYPKRDETYIKKWNDIINSLSNDKEQLKSVKTLLSLGFWGSNKNEIFTQLTGSGGNGKGLLDTGIQVVYGNYYQSINSNQLTSYEKDNQRANSELASCRFARIVMATEPEDSFNGKKTTLKVPTLKKWTGGDIIQTRFLHKDVFRYTAKFTLMMQLNDLLDLSTNDDAIKRRMRIIELPFKFVENTGQSLAENEKYRDDTLKTTIIQDNYRNALFYILLDTWLENNGKFYQSNRVREITSEFFQNQNPVKLWFDELYDFDRDSKTNATDLFNHFKNENYDTTLTMTAFGRLLKEFCKYEKNGKIYYFCKRKTC
tara:strand:- start:411 stop:3134 length:2724 start_codon:yes stop_codon:yes gene_type:complete